MITETADSRNPNFFMREAIRLAEEGMSRGDGGPFGAVIVQGDRIIGRGWNRVLATNDPTAHAEIVAIRDACSRSGNYWLQGCRMYVSCEPCPMCLAAVYWARIETLTYAATREDAAAIEFADDHIYREIGLPAEKRSLQIKQAMREEALQVMEQWITLEYKQPY